MQCKRQKFLDQYVTTLIKKCRWFIWGEDEETHKVHHFSWDCLQRPTDQRGLGVCST